jgi:beta-barrel assembly-enhancing protease
MRAAVIILALLLTAAPAHAQLGGILNKAQKAKDTADKVADLNISEDEERRLGENVSANLREKFGVYQNAEVTKYVSLVGNALAQGSSRPNLNWTFIVLDTDAVNAFAAPGGIVHVTRGLLGLAKNEAELAGVLGHEITHVTAKHTVRFIQKSKGISLGSDYAGGGSTRDYIVAKMSEKAFHLLLDGAFSREDEGESDKVGVELANKLGYAPDGLAELLKKLDARNGGREDRNGLFASHPDTKDRIAKIEKEVKDEKLTGSATVASRYTTYVTFDAKPIGEIAASTEGAAGLAGDGKDAKKDDEKKEEPKKKGGLLGKFTTSSSEQKQASQTTASAGSRGVGTPDRDAKGGPNKSALGVKVTPSDIDAFKKGIVA